MFKSCHPDQNTEKREMLKSPAFVGFMRFYGRYSVKAAFYFSFNICTENAHF